jgi:hypothetical protein
VPSPDVFLRYSSPDRQDVTAVQKLIEVRGITTFVDRSNLIAGVPWAETLERALQEVKAVAVFIRRGLGSWQHCSNGLH